MARSMPQAEPGFDPPAMPAAFDQRNAGDGSRPHRSSRRAGIAVLVVGLLAVLVGASLLRPGIAGRPSVTPTPVEGSCLLIAGPSAVDLPCTKPHNAEVTQVWAAGDTSPDAPAAKMSTASPGSLTDFCYPAEAAYLAYSRPTRADGIWLPIGPIASSHLLQDPRALAAGEPGWIACVLSTRDQLPWVGSVRGGSATLASWPSAFGACYVDRDDADSDGGTRSCAEPHQIELIGLFNTSALPNDGVFDVPYSESDLDRACADVVAATTGAADPTFGGRLRRGTEALNPAATYDLVTQGTDGGPQRAIVPRPFCFVEVVGSDQLTGTVIGLGIAALPVQ